MPRTLSFSLMLLFSCASECFALTDTLSLSRPSDDGFAIDRDRLSPDFMNLDSDSGSSENAPHRKLLPDRMSLWETFLWGEHGILRFGQLTPQSRKNELAWRNTMLQVHQALGLITWGSMVTTLVFGQLYLNGDSRLRNYHTTAASITEVLYAGTAALALFSPPPLIRRSETSTITVHKTLAYIHAAGMILLPILAQNIRQRNGRSGFLPLNVSRARAHQIAGYITTATFTAAILVVTF